MSSALRETTLDPGVPASPEALRFQVAERLAAHRNRRACGQAQMPVENLRPKRSELDARAARIAEIVAQRYAHSQSYRAYLAAEAERVVQQAQAAAEVATLNAEAMLAAQRTLLDQLSQDAFESAVAPAELEAVMATEELFLDRQGDEETEGTPPAELIEGLLQELLLWPDAAIDERKPSPRGRAVAASLQKTSPARSHAAEASPFASAAVAVAHATSPQEMSSSRAANVGLRVRLYDEAAQFGLASRTQGPAASASVRASGSLLRCEDVYDEAEARALDEEIVFRQAPVFEESAGRPMPLPANLIEFPRQLVASRKARPRLAEGPLREDREATPGAGQLRIFEVDSAQIDTTPANAPAGAGAPMPQWTSIWLDTPGQGAAGRDSAGTFSMGEQAESEFATNTDRASGLPQVASIRRRVAASAIDGGIILGGVLGGAGSFVLTCCHSLLPSPGASPMIAPGEGLRGFVGQTGLQSGMVLAASAVTFALLYVLYQALFFSFSEATPGMRLARIALCTFTEENPARSALRRRVIAILFSACPLGLGFLWAVLDEERLTWHDRASRMYQRSY
jgi:uncharacterized RDD family membrane protein YckC